MMSPNLILAAAAGTLTAQILTVILAFFITMFILVKLAWGPILRLIDERRATIKQEFDTLESRQADLESKMKDYEERLRQIDNEARERLNEKIDEGKKAAAQLLAEAHKSADAMKDKASAEIAIEVEKARVLLRDEAVSLTIAATERLLHAKLNDEQHRAMVGKFVEELQQAKAS